MNKKGAVISLYNIMRRLYCLKLGFLSKLLYYLILLLFNCVIPPQAKIGKGTRITHPVGIVLHTDTEIGENCTICQNVSITNAKVRVGNNCFLGTGCVIIGPCVIGDNVKIGANTVVNFDVPSGVTVVGIKGRIIEKVD